MAIKESVKESIKLILPRGLEHSHSVFELTQLLRSFQIEGVGYSIFQNYSNHLVRRLTILSHNSLVEHYLEHLNVLPESALLEYQKFPLLQNKIFCPYDPKYSFNFVARQMELESGVKNAITFSFFDAIQEKAELFWFYTFDDYPLWLMRQMNNISDLYRFILFFKQQLSDVIHKPLLSDREVQEFYVQNPCTQTDVDRSADLMSEYGFKQYHLGFPFKKPLSHKEFMTLKLSFLGFTAKESAQKLEVSHRTVETQLKIIQSKTYFKSLKKIRQALFQCSLFMNLIQSEMNSKNW